MAPNQQRSTALLVRDGTIAAIGSDPDVRAESGPRFDDIDCDGDLVVPAFIDAHVHLLSYAASLVSVDVSPAVVGDLNSLLATVAARAETTPPGQWIRAYGYRETELAGRRHPTRWDLDSVAPRHPVRLIHGSGHGSVLNSMALQRVAITNESEEPPGGFISRRLDDGDPDGLLLEMEHVLDGLIPRSEPEELHRGVAEANRRLVASGIACVHDLGVRNDASTLALFKQFRRDGTLSVDVVPALGIDAFLSDEVRGWTGLVKVAVNELDGLRPDVATLSRWLYSIDKAGARAAVHAVSAGAIRHVLDAFEGAGVGWRRLSPWHRIEHAAICPPDLAHRIAALGLVAVCNPGFVFEGGDRYLREVRTEDQPFLHNPSTLLSAGAVVAAGSDAPVSAPDPVASIRASLVRRSSSGRRVPGKLLNLEAALALHTCSAAIAGGQAASLGRLSKGETANLVRLPRALLEPVIRQTTAGKLRAMRAGAWVEG